MLASTTRVHAPPASGLAPRSRGAVSVARRPARFAVGDARRTVHLTRAVSEPPAAGPGEVERAPARASEPGPDEEAAEAAAREIALELAVIADETRAADVRVLGVSRKVHWARYFILATAFNRPQMQAVATKMRDHLNEKHGLSLAKNVTQQGDWCASTAARSWCTCSRRNPGSSTTSRRCTATPWTSSSRSRRRGPWDEFEVF